MKERKETFGVMSLRFWIEFGETPAQTALVGSNIKALNRGATDYDVSLNFILYWKIKDRRSNHLKE